MTNYFLATSLMDDIPFYCKLCTFLFFDLTSLQNHKLKHEYAGKASEDKNKIKPFKKKQINFELDKEAIALSDCQICNKVLRSSRGLTRHLKNVHNQIKLYSCNTCNKPFTRLEYLNNHNDYVHKGIEHECDQCGSLHNSRLNLKFHIKVTHGPNSENLRLKPNKKRIRQYKVYPCLECNAKCRKKYSRCIDHNIYCEKCGYSTKSWHKDNLKKHQTRSRCDPQKVCEKFFKCPYCPMRFTTEKYRYKHEQQHKPNNLCKLDDGKLCSDSKTLQSSIKVPTDILLATDDDKTKAVEDMEDSKIGFRAGKDTLSLESPDMNILTTPTNVSMKCNALVVVNYTVDHNLVVPETTNVSAKNFNKDNELLERSMQKHEILEELKSNEIELKAITNNLPLKRQGPVSKQIDVVNVSTVSNDWKESSLLQKSVTKLPVIEVQENYCLENKEHIKDIIKRHDNTSLHICDECKEEFESKKVLKIHLYLKHELTTTTCYKCSKTFESNQSLNKHNGRFHKKLERSCFICELIFQSAEGLSGHIKKHYTSKEACNICHKLFLTQSLKRHIDHVHKQLPRTTRTYKPKPKINPCSECKVKFPKQFIKCSDHNIYCDRCGFAVKASRSNNLKEHQASSRCDPLKVWNKSYKCEYCVKGFTTEKNKNKHELDHHVVGKRYKCVLCGFCCSSTNGLKKHIEKNICHGGNKLHERKNWY